MKQPMNERPVLQIVQELCLALAAEDICYCHWKSNAALDRSASGDNDIDILISRADMRRFVSLLFRLGFTEARVSPARQLPGILDYYGLDQASMRLVHVHAHYQLVLGDDMTKNYRLPIERAYLASSVTQGLFKVPSPEFELLVLVLRLSLKHSTWDSLLFLQGSMPARARGELEYLQARADPAKLQALLKQHLPWLSAELFDSCLRALRPGANVAERVLAGQRLERALHGTTRQPRAGDVGRKLARRAERVLRRQVLRQRPRKRRMPQGGMLIAVVGGDGAGKSTTVKGLQSWLGKNFDTITVHMGRPTWSLTTRAVRTVLGLGRLLGLFPYAKLSELQDLPAAGAPAVNYPALLRAVCTARDRYRAYVRARRFATNGGIVILDRFPLPGMMAMDGPQAGRAIPKAARQGLVGLLVQLEQRYYERIGQPELLLALRVDPELAVQRKTDEPAHTVRARNQAFWALDWSATAAHVFDASRPHPELLAAMKALIWSEL